MKKFLKSISLAILTLTSATIVLGIPTVVDSSRLLGIYGKDYGDNSTKATGNDHLAELQAFIGLYNTNGSQLGYSINHATSPIVPGASIPAPLLSIPSTHNLGNGSYGGGTTLTETLPASGAAWLGLKSSNEVAFFYIGDLTGDFTVTNPVLGGGGGPRNISNWSYYGTGTTSVPDTGSTLVLLGLGLGLLGFLKRRK